MHRFKSRLEIIGINPFVFVPGRILEKIFLKAGKDKGAIPVRGTVNGDPFRQTLVRYKGDWRLYINTAMLKDSPRRTGELLKISIDFDAEPRTIKMHTKLREALRKSTAARKSFDALSPSRQKEIVRYISSLKSEESIKRNIIRALGFLTGKNGFVGRKSV